MLKGGISQMMRQAQKMQENMQKAQEKLAESNVEGSAGGGMVRVVMNCRNIVHRVSIDDSLINDDKDMLEDLVAAALNDALRKAEAMSQEHMGALTSGLQLPPGFKMPF